MAWHTEDYGLTPGQLVKKYGDDEEHYAFPQRNWCIAVEKESPSTATGLGSEASCKQKRTSC